VDFRISDLRMYAKRQMFRDGTHISVIHPTFVRKFMRNKRECRMARLSTQRAISARASIESPAST